MVAKMTARKASSPVAGQGSAPRRRLAVSDRLAVFVLAIVFGWLLQVVYRDIILASGVYNYIGLHWRGIGLTISAAFLFLGVLPALWLPLQANKPSQMMALLLHLLVVIPIAALMPNLSYSPLASQFLFVACVVLGLGMISSVGSLPPLSLRPPRLSRPLFRLLMATILFAALIVLSSGASINIGLSLFEVYAAREAFLAQADNLGRVFLYTQSAIIYAFGPFLVAIGLVSRNPLALLAGVVLLAVVFFATSFRMAYFAVFAVIGLWLLIRMFPRRTYAGMLLAFIGLVAVCALADLFLISSVVPYASWVVIFRLFGNAGFLSAGYFDFFFDNEKIIYTQSILAPFFEPRYEVPVPKLIGEFWTDNPENHANANLWADAYANLGYHGILLISLILSLVLWIFDSLARSTSNAVGVLLIVMPSFALSNIGLHTAILSGGVLFALLLLMLVPPRFGEAGRTSGRPSASSGGFASRGER
ncbi:MAG: hypothetical protein JJ942_17955 [Roseitalea sp.]|nr:hypothetical protein [Roseitalea sp.]